MKSLPAKPKRKPGRPKNKIAPDKNPHIVERETLTHPKYGSRPSRYDPNWHPRIGRWMAHDGQSVNAMCAEFGISTQTFYIWKDRYIEFKKAVEEGRELVDSMVESALLKKALGYSEEWEEVTTEYKGLAIEPPDGGTPLEVPGTLVEVSKKITRKKKILEPCILSIKFWLTNRQKDKWKGDQALIKHQISGDPDGKPVKLDLSGLTIEELKYLEVITQKLEVTQIKKNEGDIIDV